VCGQVCLFLGRYGEAVRFLTESLAIAREHGNARRIASFLQPLGLAALGGGQIEAARAYLEEALILARTQGNPRETAAALNALAQALRLGGRLDPVETLYREALQLARSSEDHDSAAVTLINLAMVLTQRGELAAARRHLDEGLKLGEQLASRALDQAVLDACAGLAAACGERQIALRFIAGAEALADQTRLRRPPADQAFLAPLLAAIAERAAGALPAPGDEADGAAAVADVLAAARRWVAGATVDQRSFMMIGSSGGSDLPASSSTRMV
jgi:tetratricopeptide (TPR) repeat protein